MKMSALKGMEMSNKCKQCGKKFTPVRKGHIFCSKYCREQNWIKNNPEKVYLFSRNHWMKIKKNSIIICKYCKKEISFEEREGGRVYHKECSKFQNRLNNKKYSQKAFKKFIKYKEQRGCKICGYNECGACLDFHHKNEETKERRITAKMWISGSELIKEELKKCVLLCKNCHYKLHYMKGHYKI